MSCERARGRRRLSGAAATADSNAQHDQSAQHQGVISRLGHGQHESRDRTCAASARGGAIGAGCGGSQHDRALGGTAGAGTGAGRASVETEGIAVAVQNALAVDAAVGVAVTGGIAVAVAQPRDGRGVIDNDNAIVLVFLFLFFLFLLLPKQVQPDTGWSRPEDRFDPKGQYE